MQRAILKVPGCCGDRRRQRQGQGGSIQMSSKKLVFSTTLLFSILMLGASLGVAQNTSNPLAVTGSLPKTPLPPPATSGPIELQSVPVSPQEPPIASVPP